MARKSNKQSNKNIVPQTPNDVKETKKGSRDVKVRVNPIYKRFLDGLSSSERDVILAEPVGSIRWVPSFRKFLENLKDEELLLLVK